MKRTYQPSILVQKRRHGFLKRKASPNGILIIKNRKLKRRKSISH